MQIMSPQTGTSAQRHCAANGPGLYIMLTITAAIVAALAAFTSAFVGLPPWAMFLGWVAYFTRQPSPAQGLQTFLCVLLGLALGAAAVISLGQLAPMIGPLALPIIVFGVALIVIGTRGLKIVNNLLGYFIGLITFFAAHLEPALESLAQLASASAIGLFAGWGVQAIEGRVRSVVAR
jgi:hypothetical protein